jgi:glycosyltransferase involved in cell wall biosynthesis
MVNVAHIITRMDMGGSAQNTLDTCLHLDPKKYGVFLIHGLSRESDMTTEECNLINRRLAEVAEKGVRVIALPSLVRRIDVINDVKALLLLMKFMRREKPTVVHTHTSKAGLLGRLAAWLTGVPIIIQTPHGHVFYGHFGALPSKLFLVLERMAALITHRLVALTEREKSDYLRVRVAPARKLLTVHSGVRIQRYLLAPVNGHRMRASLGIHQDQPVIGFVGWLLPVKGVRHLLRAMARVCRRRPEVRLVCVGKGRLEATLKKDAQRLGIREKVLFLGWRGDVEIILPAVDILVLPSLNEGMGRVLVEAMAAGRPVVASDVGGIPDLVRNGENGLLVPPGDVPALANAILALLDNPESARQMGERGRTVCRNFSLEAMIEKIERLYGELLEERLRCSRRSFHAGRPDGGHRPEARGHTAHLQPQPATSNPQPATKTPN